MGFDGHKLTEESFRARNVQSIEDTTVIGRAEWLKQQFDAAAMEVIMPAFNALIDALAESGAAAGMGAAPMGEGDESGGTVAEKLAALYAAVLAEAESRAAADRAEAAARENADALKANADRVYTREEIGARVDMERGALASLAGVASPGGDVALQGGTGIRITADPAGRSITITAVGEATPAAHGTEHEAAGGDPITLRGYAPAAGEISPTDTVAAAFGKVAWALAELETAKSGPAENLTATLPATVASYAASGDGYTVAVTASGIELTGYNYIVNPAAGSYDAFVAAGVRMLEPETVGQAIFYVSEIPTTEIGVMIMKVEAA